LRGNFGALAIRTLDAFFVVFADGHGDGESLVALLAEIFVEGHRGGPFYTTPIEYKRPEIA
jgi:hypothetical protein